MVLFPSVLVLMDLGGLMVLGLLSMPLLTLVILLEGGLGLLVGVGISLSSTPSVARVGQTLFETSPWSKESERHAARVGIKWIIASAFLVLVGFAVSAL